MNLRAVPAALATVAISGALVMTGAVLATPPSPPRIVPPSCGGQGVESYCYMDLPDCRELVFHALPDGTVTWHQQDWCTGETVVD